MRLKKQSICLLLAVLIFLSGMWFENDRADSFAECVSTGVCSSDILSADDTVSRAQLCTEEMLSVRINVGLLQLAGRFAFQTRRARLLVNFLYLDPLSTAEGKFFPSSEETHFFSQCPDELVVNYIHLSDGKKRI